MQRPGKGHGSGQIGDGDTRKGQGQGDDHTLREQPADLTQTPFSCPAGDQGLETVIESLADHGKKQVVDAGDAGGRQGLAGLVQMTEEDVIGDEIDLGHENSQADR